MSADVASCLLRVRADGASDPDAEPDEGAADGHADRLVPRVPQILWHLLCGGFGRTRCRVSVCTQEGSTCVIPPDPTDQSQSPVSSALSEEANY